MMIDFNLTTIKGGKSMRKIKRVLSICLSLVLIVCTFPIYSSANNVIETAIAWATGIANDNTHGYSQANRYGPDYDCSSLVTTAFRNAGINVPYDCNTRNMKDRFVNAGFVWIPANSIPNFPGSSANLKRGDILLKSGHTELYIGNNQNIGAHDNYNGIPGGIGGDKKWSDGYKDYRYGADEIDVCKYWNGSWIGVLRYADGQTLPNDSAPTIATLSIDKKEFRIGEAFTFSASSDAVCSYYLSVFDADSGEKVIEGTMDSFYTTSFLRAGHYSAYMSAFNSIGSVDSNWIDFYVFGDRPTNAVLTIDKENILLGDSVTLTTKTDAYYSKIYMSIFNSNGTRIFAENVSNTHTFTPDYNDTYSCYVSAYTHEGGVDSNKVTFVVGEHIQDENNVILSVSNVTVKSNDVFKVSFSMSGETNINSLSIGNLKYDKSLLTIQNKEWKLSDSVISSTDGDYSVIKFSDNRDCNGVVYEVTFSVADVNSFVETEISCDATARYELSDGKEETVDIEINNGLVEINGKKSLDYDNNGYETTDDAVYVLKHIMMPDIFELIGDVDFDKNGHETTDDAVYLLKHIMMPDLYPI